MKVLFGTSVLVAALVKPYPHHKKAFLCLKCAIEGYIAMIISSHTLAELYHVLTKFPGTPAFSTVIVKQIIKENIVTVVKIVSLSPAGYMPVIEKTADYGLTGGIGLWGIAYRKGRWVAVGEFISIYSDDNGVTWNSGAPVSGVMKYVQYGNGRFAAVGHSGILRYSENGIDWIDVTSQDTTHLYGLCYKE
jgi:predicted nucleic acid-binding protein